MTHFIKIPDSKMAREAIELVRDTESELLFNHSNRVFQWGALEGQRRELHFDRELLLIGALFHDMGLTQKCCSKHERFEVDGANAAGDFLKRYKLHSSEIDLVWTSIALHTTPGIPKHMHPLIALVTVGVEMDNMSFGFENFTPQEREVVVKQFPRGAHFKNDIMEAFYEGTKFKPETTFGTFNDDVIAAKDPSFKPINYCSLIKNSKWAS